jgi:DNA polymerase I
MPANTLLLVDGTNVAYRGFYAIATLSTKSGRPTNALFGFIKMFHQLQQLWSPSHWAVAFDGGLPEERLTALATYKAQRKPMPDALREQFPAIEEFLARSNVPSIRLEAQEADDVIATLADRSCAAGMDVLIASSDKDLCQLVGDRVFVVAPSKAGAKMGPAEVVEKMGVAPGRIVDWLALTGDNVDNIPGVPGVGPKTATRLIEQFGSLEQLLANTGRIESERIRGAIEASRDAIARNQELVRLRRDLPVAMALNEMKVRKPDAARLVAFYDEMEFRSLAEGLRKVEREGPMLNFGDLS